MINFSVGTMSFSVETILFQCRDEVIYFSVKTRSLTLV